MPFIVTSALEVMSTPQSEENHILKLETNKAGSYNVTRKLLNSAEKSGLSN